MNVWGGRAAFKSGALRRGEMWGRAVLKWGSAPHPAPQRRAFHPCGAPVCGRSDHTLPPRNQGRSSQAHNILKGIPLRGRMRRALLGGGGEYGEKGPSDEQDGADHAQEWARWRSAN